MVKPFLERKSPFGMNYALLILVVFFFLIPSAFQSARLSLREKENDVKDWLPSDFPETAELKWFAKHFTGESFVLATWPGCTADDQRLRLLEQKLIHETDTYDPASDLPPEYAEEYARARKLGEEFSLLDPGNDFFNWGGQREKWLCSPAGAWYYITPDGSLYRWDGAMNGPAGLVRAIKRATGNFELKGQLLTALRVDTDQQRTNPFYNDPSLICAPLFHSVQTGVSIAAELSAEHGALWPIDLTDAAEKPAVARRLAVERLTGTLFAPPVPDDFAWTAEAFTNQVPADKRDSLEPDFGFVVNAKIDEIVEDRFDGNLESLRQATSEDQATAWLDVFEAADVEPPPPLTCVVVTLTDLGQENLAFALGRGIMGGPRGRLLQLAEESGIRPAAPPSMAPPPFNQPPPEELAGLPALRIGGPPVDNIAIDEEGTITLVRLVGYSVLVGVFLSFICFRSIKITIIVFIVGGTAAMLSMAFVGWTGGSVDAILMSMPSLVYVLGISGAIHVINYYRDECRARGERGAAGRALSHAVLPCTLASVTTAIGLASLYTSNLAPISNFGLYAAIGVIATLAILFSYLPSSLEIFAPAMPDAKQPGEDAEPAKEGKLSEIWAAVGRWIVKRHWAVSAVCTVALVGATIGLADVKTSVQLLKLFDSDSRIIHDYAWLEDNFGKLVPMELVVRVPPSMQKGKLDDQGNPVADIKSLSLIERVEAVSRVRTVVHRALGERGMGVVGEAMSADTFLPPLPKKQRGWGLARSSAEDRLTESIAELRESDYLRTEESGPLKDSELWRISLRVGALSDVDYGLFISTLRTSAEPVLRAYDTREAIIETLAVDLPAGKTMLSGKQFVAVIGAAKPQPLAEIDFYSPEDESIDADSAYLATLAELLDPLAKNRWFDNEMVAKLQAAGKWDAALEKLDAVVWVGGKRTDGTDMVVSDFDSAKNFVNASEIRNSVAVPGLTPERVPTVDSMGSLDVVYTGVVPVVYKAQRTLLSSLVESIGLAFVLIAGVMIVLLNPGRTVGRWLRPKNLFNGLGAGAVSMIPNVFPVLFVFGLMGHGSEIWTGHFLVDIGTMMTASVAMGVAVDDTIHFLSWFRTYLDQGMSRVDAVIETYRRVGPAMTQTTLVGGLGLFVFALSTFTPTQRFGTLMLGMLAVALIGDLVFLPALLAGPLGRFFKPRDIGDSGPEDGHPGQPIETTEATSESAPAPTSAPATVDDSPAPVANSLPAGLNEGEPNQPALKMHVTRQRVDGPHPLRKKS